MKGPVLSDPSELGAGLSHRKEVVPVKEREHVEEERLGEGEKLHDEEDVLTAKVSC